MAAHVLVHAAAPRTAHAGRKTTLVGDALAFAWRRECAAAAQTTTAQKEAGLKAAGQQLAAMQRDHFGSLRTLRGAARCSARAGGRANVTRPPMSN